MAQLWTQYWDQKMWKPHAKQITETPMFIVLLAPDPKHKNGNHNVNILCTYLEHCHSQFSQMSLPVLAPSFKPFICHFHFKYKHNSKDRINNHNGKIKHEHKRQNQQNHNTNKDKSNQQQAPKQHPQQQQYDSTTTAAT